MGPVAKIVLAGGVLRLAGVVPAWGVDLSIPTQIAGPGASVPISVSFASHGESVSGLQFDLTFDTPTLSLVPVVGEAARNSGKALRIATVDSSRTRFLITELNQNPISDGTVINLFVNISPGSAPGSYKIGFQSAIASDPAGNGVAVNTVDGSIQVQGTSGAPISPDGVLNGASLEPGAVAPGEIVTIMGSAIAPASLSGTYNLSFGGFPAPLLYVSPGQVNAVVPFGINGRDNTTLEIATPSGARALVPLSVAPSAPAIFTLSGSGTGQGAIVNQDGTVNSADNPAQRGSIIALFATGAGQTNPAGTDGLIAITNLPKPRLPIAVQIDNATAEILYAGAAPYQISGVVQVNCRVPLGVKVGRSMPVLLSVGGATSPPVTMAID